MPGKIELSFENDGKPYKYSWPFNCNHEDSAEKLPKILLTIITKLQGLKQQIPLGDGSYARIEISESGDMLFHLPDADVHDKPLCITAAYHDGAVNSVLVEDLLKSKSVFSFLATHVLSSLNKELLHFIRIIYFSLKLDLENCIHISFLYEDVLRVYILRSNSWYLYLQPNKEPSEELKQLVRSPIRERLKQLIAILQDPKKKILLTDNTYARIEDPDRQTGLVFILPDAKSREPIRFTLDYYHNKTGITVEEFLNDDNTLSFLQASQPAISEVVVEPTTPSLTTEVAQPTTSSLSTEVAQPTTSTLSAEVAQPIMSSSATSTSQPATAGAGSFLRTDSGLADSLAKSSSIFVAQPPKAHNLKGAAYLNFLVIVTTVNKDKKEGLRQDNAYPQQAQDELGSTVVYLNELFSTESGSAEALSSRRFCLSYVKTESKTVWKSKKSAFKAALEFAGVTNAKNILDKLDTYITKQKLETFITGMPSLNVHEQFNIYYLRLTAADMRDWQFNRKFINKFTYPLEYHPTQKSLLELLYPQDFHSPVEFYTVVLPLIQKTLNNDVSLLRQTLVTATNCIIQRIILECETKKFPDIIKGCTIQEAYLQWKLLAEINLANFTNQSPETNLQQMAILLNVPEDEIKSLDKEMQECWRTSIAKITIALTNNFASNDVNVVQQASNADAVSAPQAEYTIPGRKL